MPDLTYPPNTPFEARLTGFSTGLVGTIGVSIRDNVGNVPFPRTIANITEDPAGSGSYVTVLVAPITPGQYSIVWDDGTGEPSGFAFEDLLVTGAYQPSPILPGEILASIDDINANLDKNVVVAATPENTNLLQISVARIIRGYLARAIDTATLVGWDSPPNTPDIIREAAAKLIAAQLYFNETSRTSITVEDTHYAQKLYDRAMEILNGILGGTIVIENVTVGSISELSDLDFFPTDDTDRAFTLGMQF
jgi:hypothetical protein